MELFVFDDKQSHLPLANCSNTISLLKQKVKSEYQ